MVVGTNYSSKQILGSSQNRRLVPRRWGLGTVGRTLSLPRLAELINSHSGEQQSIRHGADS
jgi:hypothetical protein